MTGDRNAVPPGIDIERPSVARLYDFFLGGNHNFASDRELGRRLLTAEPNARSIVRANRDFLGRAVRHLLDQGVRQFLDLGSGIPTQENVHEIAHRRDPGSRVVYVDNDPAAVAHSRMILRDVPAAAVINEDLRNPEAVLAHQAVRDLLDFDQPIGVLMVTVLHFVPDADRPHELVARYRDALAPGSHLVVSHATSEAAPDAAAEVEKLYESSRAAAHTRGHEEIAGFFAGFEVIEPGVVYLPLWRPQTPDLVENPEEAWFYAGVGRLGSGSGGGTGSSSRT